MKSTKKKILGQDPTILLALWANILSWLVQTFAPSLLTYLLPKCEEEEEQEPGGDENNNNNMNSTTTRTRCISIGRPGGIEQLRLITLKAGICTCGYNVKGQGCPFTAPIVSDTQIPEDCVVLRNEAFSVNYADCCIRWGLYESANKFVGYPMVPGFDVAGTVERVGSKVSTFRRGDKVFGCTFFGGYSSRVVVPEIQLRKIPNGLSMSEAASLPAVSLTSLYALFLAGHFPAQSRFSNRAIAIHSAAGGVGSMLVQMSKLLGLAPIVGIVGRTTKVEAAQSLGCNVVIDKSQCHRHQDLWKQIRSASPSGYSTIMDSNGVATLSDSYDHLAMAGRLIVFGFHTNLPMGKAMLSPLEWIRMAWKAQKMPKFDPMEMGSVNRGVLAFNLSFFTQERDTLSQLFDQILAWLEQGKLDCPRIVEMDMEDIANAHELIQSGKSIGKIILQTNQKRG